MIRTVTTEELKDLLNNDNGKEVILIDTLAKTSYDAHHIPSAYNVSYQKEYSKEDVCAKNKVALDIETRFLQTFEKDIHPPKDTAIVTYSGSAGCGLSYLAALCLERVGYTNIIHYNGGLYDWKESGSLVATV